MALKVYGSPASMNVATVLLTLYEKNVTDFVNVDVDMMVGEQKQPPYLAKQPFGEVPCIEDGDLTLFESRAIARYLGDKFEGQGADLYPKDLTARAVVDQWLEVQAHALLKPVSAITRERWFAPTFIGTPCDETVVVENMKELGNILDIYDSHLSKNRYLAGDFFSLAEISHSTLINYLLFAAPVEGAEILKNRKHVKAWWVQITSRPSWTKFIKLFNTVLVELGMNKD